MGILPMGAWAGSPCHGHGLEGRATTVSIFLCAFLWLQGSEARTATPSTAPAPEYSYEAACRDWPEIQTRITVIGAKHSPFHAAVYSDGTVALAGTAWCEADRWLLEHRPTRLLLSFAFGDPPQFIRSPQDQSLLEGSLPVVITSIAMPAARPGACTFEQQALAHLLGAAEALTGREPLIGRLRLRVRNPQNSPARAVVWVQFSAMEHKPGIDQQGQMLLFANATPQPIPYEGGSLRLEGARMLDQKGNLRALVEAPAGSSMRLFTRSDLPADSDRWEALRKTEPLDHLLRIELPVPPAGESAVRITAPVFPLEAAAARELEADGFEPAWQRTIAGWRRELAASAVQLRVAEPELLDMLRSYPWQVMIKMDREPGTSALIPKVNALLYEGVWGHLTAMECNALDHLGYHDAARQYLQAFLEWQGGPRTTCKAEGITDWSGFLGADLKYTYWNWATHHGYLMWALADHFLLTGDRAWFDRVKPKLLKAATWTIRQIDSTRQGAEGGNRPLNWGLFPASVSTDLTQHIDNAAFNDAWMYRGLSFVAEALRVAGDPQAASIRARAGQYRDDIRTAWRRAIAECPPQKLVDGSQVPFVPGLLHMRDWRDTLGKQMGPGFLVFYLMDTGPLHFGQCGVFGPGDPEMEWALRLIRDGPPEVRFLTHGVSTCEICFAPQFDYYLAIDEPVRAIEVLYSSLAGAMSRKTFSGWEFRGGIQGLPAAAAVIASQFRLMLVRESGGFPDEGLWLAQATPRGWLEDGKVIEVNAAPTHFGPVTYKLSSRVSQNQIVVDVSPPSRREPKWLRLRLRHPDGLAIRRVEAADGQRVSFSGDTIELPRDRLIQLIAHY